MTVATRFDAFLNNLNLTDAQRSDGATKRENVCSALNIQYWGSTSGIANSRYVGSWDKLTRIRPPRDVDVLFKLPRSVYDRFELRSGNKQSQLLQEVRAVIANKYPNTTIRGDGPVIMVNFTSYNVEILPAFLNVSDQYLIPITTNGGKYNTTDPDAERSSLKISSDKSNGMTRHLVRMIKCWQGECNVPIKSFWLELCAISFISQWEYSGKTSMYYDWMVRDFFKYLVQRANGYVFVPGTSEMITLGEAWKSRAESARDRAIKACTYEGSEMSYAALEEWQKIFGRYIT